MCRWASCALLWAAILSAQQDGEPDALLARIQSRVREDLARLPDYVCVQTVDGAHGATTTRFPGRTAATASDSHLKKKWSRFEVRSWPTRKLWICCGSMFLRTRSLRNWDWTGSRPAWSTRARRLARWLVFCQNFPS